MEPPSPPFLPPAPPLDDWQVALCVVAVGAAVLCLGCALQVKSSTSRVSSYDPRRDPTLVRTIECMLGCLSRHATSPDVVMQAVDALHASRHLLVPVGAAGSRRRPASVTWLAALPGHGAGRPRRPRGRRAASKRPRREGLPRSLAVACSAMRLLTPHTSTKQAGLPRGGISHALAYISLDLRVSPCISPHLPGGAASRRGQLAAARAPDCAGVRRPDAPRACLYLPISPCISVHLAISPRRAAARCSSCSTW